jgi:polyhydroxyalkanoate synthase
MIGQIAERHRCRAPLAARSRSPAMQRENKHAPASGPDLGAYRIADPEVFMHNMLSFIENGSKALANMATKGPTAMDPVATAKDAQDTGRLLADVAQRWASQPGKLASAQTALARSYVDLWAQTLQRMFGQETTPLAAPEPGDNRFKHPDWSENPYFDFWKQAYLLTTKWAEGVLADTDGLDDHTRHRVDFLLKQVTTAMSPTNFPATNPEVLRETFQSNGANLVKGVENLLKDMANSGALLKISQTDTDAFEIGRNVATTPGKVVFQNDIIQLIQYTPTTKSVHETPFLLVPPWINKFYILDLTAERSFIRYALDQGISLFVVSWVNPDARLASKTFEDYMNEGILAATDAVQRETGQKQVNVLGYCVGGTLLGSTLAYLAARGETPYKSATFLAAQVDFTKAGDLKVFIDDEQLKAIEHTIDTQGYLDGSSMATVFNMLRPRDLIWPYVVNNYMLGKKPIAFDLLYWNQDSTRMPGANHKFYLREFYHENKLTRGLLKLGGVRLDLGKVELPIYMLAAREDHIAPSTSVMLGARHFGGPVTYVMSGSGHIAGVINPPGKKPKYQYWTNPKPLAHPDNATFESWVAGASETPGSWWPHWIQWLKKYSGELIPARAPGATLGTIEDAPGSYVKAKA